jgi:hypothetical protein
MVRVRMRESLIGLTFAVQAGDEYVCDLATAQRLVAEGLAEFIGAPEPDTMMRNPAVERAVKPRPKARG